MRAWRLSVLMDVLGEASVVGSLYSAQSLPPKKTMNRENNCNDLNDYGNDEVFAGDLRTTAAARLTASAFDYVRVVVHLRTGTQNASQSVPMF